MGAYLSQVKNLRLGYRKLTTDDDENDVNDADIENTDAQKSCVLCLFRDPNRLLKCGHVFCYTCIHGWIETCNKNKTGDRCPICGVKLKIRGRIKTTKPYIKRARRIS